MFYEVFVGFMYDCVLVVVELGKWLRVSASWLGVLGVVGGKV